ncbi:MAG: WD40 repeat domain-containing protein, partial [Verrucomicrobiota bacterium]|nr:WD40 repeat domain-containing protein [Verrucomicrobiota bacterium]
MPAPETAETHSSELPRSELWLFGVTIFLGAFLLFQVQPVIGKYILPWFGGTPGVWTTCLLFFQCLLLGGYAYAHWLSQLAPRRQAQIHLTLLGIVGVILGGVFLSMIGGLSPIEWLKPDPATAADRPVLGILTLLLVGIGLPYLVLSSTGPLIQAWFARKYEGRSPYRLYALSNVGSLLALITYPFLVEPYTTRGLQVGAWAFGMVGFAVICGWLARSIRRIPEADTESESKSQVKAPDLKRQLLWLLLPACGTAQLMATTNKVSQDVAVTPFLWILPLTLYLLSFIIAFDSPRWYSRLVYTLLLVGCWGGTLWILKKGVDSDILAQVGILNLTLFLGCMVCHGELYKLRPEPALLTRYFLTISAGGALGGLFVALVAPTIFDGYWEYQLAVWGCGALLAGVCFVDKTRWALNSWWVRLLLLASWLAVCWAVYQRGNVFVPHVWLLCLRLMFVSCFVTYLLGLLFKAPSSRPKLRLLGLAALGALCSLGDSAMTLELSGYRNLLTNPLVAFAALLLLSSISFVWSSVRGWEGWRLPAYMPLAVLVAGLGGLLLAQIRKDRENIDIQSRNFYGVIRIYDNDLTSYNVSGHKTTVTGVVISPDGLKLASTSADGDTRVWNCETIEEIWPLYTD